MPRTLEFKLQQFCTFRHYTLGLSRKSIPPPTLWIYTGCIPKFCLYEMNIEPERTHNKTSINITYLLNRGVV